MRTSQRGIALILVLWVITLLTVMALGLTASQRTGSALTRNALDTVRFRALSEAALHFAALHLLVAPPILGPDPELGVWMPDGTPHPWVFDGESMTIAIFNEGSKIDLNQADGALLTRLFDAVGVEETEAVALADAILDWRDEDDMESDQLLANSCWTKKNRFRKAAKSAENNFRMPSLFYPEPRKKCYIT